MGIFACRLNVLEPDAVNSDDERVKLPDASAGTQMPGNDAEVPKIKRQILSVGDANVISQAHKQDKMVERFAVSTGNMMIDQFEPWYLGVAFPFIFKYCTGMPDMPAWTKATRYRRKTDAPRIEAEAWVRLMSRRVEAQLSRDWNFGFVSWNYNTTYVQDVMNKHDACISEYLFLIDNVQDVMNKHDACISEYLFLIDTVANTSDHSILTSHVGLNY